MHAMRGISAHSNGFHTCRALHLLQMLLGSIDVPGGFRYKPPFPKPAPPGPSLPASPAQVAPGQPLPGPPLGFPARARGSAGRGRRQRRAASTRRISWEAPLAAHGLMHMVITNALHGDPYPIDTLFLYMANMAWNSAMNVGGTLAMLTAKDPETGDYRIPRIIYADAYFSEMVAYADLILPDTTYLERWDCISLLDRPISRAGRPGRCDPPAGRSRPTATCGRSRTCCSISARGSACPAWSNDDGSPAFPAATPITSCITSARPGIGSLAGWRGDGSGTARGAPNPDQLQRYIEHGCFWQDELPRRSATTSTPTAITSTTRCAWASSTSAEPIMFQLYQRGAAEVPAGGAGHRGPQPPTRASGAHRDLLRSAAVLVSAARAAADEHLFPLHAITQRPMAMYHSWGSQNAWLRQIQSQQPPVSSPVRAAGEMGLARWRLGLDRSAGTAGSRSQVRLMDGVNPDTVWTWNAIGKRAGAWHLARMRPRRRRASCSTT